MTGIHLVGELLAGELYLLGIDNHDIVTAIHIGSEHGLMFAPQHAGNHYGHTAQDKVLGVDQVPLFIDLRGLGGIGLHDGFHNSFAAAHLRRSIPPRRA